MTVGGVCERHGIDASVIFCDRPGLAFCLRKIGVMGGRACTTRRGSPLRLAVVTQETDTVMWHFSTLQADDRDENATFTLAPLITLGIS